MPGARYSTSRTGGRRRCRSTRRCCSTSSACATRRTASPSAPIAQKRSRAITASPLDEIPGIGPARKRALLLHFGTAGKVRAAASRICSARRGSGGGGAGGVRFLPPGRVIRWPRRFASKAGGVMGRRAQAGGAMGVAELRSVPSRRGRVAGARQLGRCRSRRERQRRDRDPSGHTLRELLCLAGDLVTWEERYLGTRASAAGPASRRVDNGTDQYICQDHLKAVKATSRVATRLTAVNVRAIGRSRRSAMGAQRR